MYLVTYTDDFDFSQQTRLQILNYGEGLTWRELQQKFDPSYRYSNLRFYLVGQQIKL